MFPPAVVLPAVVAACRQQPRRRDAVSATARRRVGSRRPAVAPVSWWEVLVIGR
jgi:hypothetical protein